MSFVVTESPLQSTASGEPAAAPPARRRFPYPYRAMLAICSDLDETPDAQAYFEIQRFLNTRADTTMGPGVGLEVGNTIYFDMPAGQFSYGSADDRSRARVRALVDSGHIDCLHSFGDHATSRDHVCRALDQLRRCKRPLEVWVDHAVAPTNFGADIMRGSGDLPGAQAYHADLTCAYGIQYVWRGRVTSVIGQDRSRSLRGVWDTRHPLASARTLAKEAAKGILAARGNEKYALHEKNELMREIRLRDGQPAREFMRCNPYWGGVENSDTGVGIANVLTERFLGRLVARGGFAIVYTHLGKVRSRSELFPEATRAAFRRLAERQQRGEILVTTTRRLLGYRRALFEAEFCRSAPNGAEQIDISHTELSAERCAVNERDFQGLTWYVDGLAPPVVRIAGRAVQGIRLNPPDECGRRSVSIPWRALEYPEL